MLTQLRIRNFRGFSDHLVPLRRTTLMVGRNNAGKSTVVEALRLLSVVTTRFRALSYHDGPPWGGIPKRESGVSPSLKGLEINFATMFHQYGDPPAVIDASFENKTSVRIYVASEDRVHAVIFDEHKQPIRTKSSAMRLDVPIVQILPQIGPVEPNELILSDDYVRRSDSSRLLSKHFRNQLRVFADRVPPFKQLVEETWSGVQVLELESARPVPGEPLSLMIRNEGFVAELAAMGHGLQMWLQTMWFLAKVDGAAAIILDEPDVYMHPDLQRRLIAHLKRRHEQVVVATHSVEMMAEVEAEDVLIVDHRRKSSSFASSTDAVQRLVEHIGSVHNLQLTRLWNARKCLLVEGKDVGLLGIAHRVLFPESESLETVPHLEIGGWGGWPYAIGSSLLLRNSVGDAISVYCILDRDYHSDDTVRQRYSEATAKGVILHIWRRKELENYFLVPDAIMRTILRRMPSRTTAPTPDELLTQLEQACDDSKDDVFDAMAAEILADDRRLGAGGANKLARQTLSERWKTLEGKLATVSGKRVFAALSDWAQRHFGVSLSATIVARETSHSEIDSELREVIEALHEDRSF
jgi:energy-coupling factor transporter ATP-binding protein EcfA2